MPKHIDGYDIVSSTVDMVVWIDIASIYSLVDETKVRIAPVYFSLAPLGTLRPIALGS